MSFATINGYKLHYEVLPAVGRRPGEPRETLVLIHGMLIDNLSSYYFTVAPALAAAGFDVVMFDHRGHGKSKKIESGYKLDYVVDDLAVLLDEIHDGSPVHLVGNSYGGTVAFSFALRFPERVATLTSIESEPPTDAWVKTIKQALADGKVELAKSDVLSRVREKYGMHGVRLAKIAQKILADTFFAAEMPDIVTVPEEAVTRLDMPVLAFYGSESHTSAQEPMMRASIKDNKTIVVQGVGHFVLMDVPELVQNEIIEWVRAHPADAIIERRKQNNLASTSVPVAAGRTAKSSI